MSPSQRPLPVNIHKAHNRQTSIGLLWTSDQPVAETSTSQHTQNSQQTDIPGRVISPSQRPLPVNIHKTHNRQTSLDEWSARRRDLYLSTYTKLTIDRHPWASDQLVAETSTCQHTQSSQQTDIRRTPLDEWWAQHRDLYLTTHNTHNRQTSMLPGRIRTHDLSMRAAADPRLRPRGHWDRR